MLDVLVLNSCDLCWQHLKSIDPIVAIEEVAGQYHGRLARSHMHELHVVCGDVQELPPSGVVHRGAGISLSYEMCAVEEHCLGADLRVVEQTGDWSVRLCRHCQPELVNIFENPY